MAKLIKFLIALVLLVPLGILSTFASAATIAQAVDVVRGLQGGALWGFAGGFAAWLLLFLILPRPTLLYVLGHELTHWFWAKLFGSRVFRFRVTSRGGHVDVDRVNFLIVLAPYIFPFYTIVVVYVWALAQLCAWLFGLPLAAYVGVFWVAVGVSWSFHVSFTVLMMLTDQPDFRSQGRFFSMTLIYLGNLVPLVWLLIAMTPGITLADWWNAFFEGARRLQSLVEQGLSMARGLR